MYVCAAYVADHHGLRPRPRMTGIDIASSVLSSDIESVSVVGSEDTRSRSTPNFSCFTTLPIFFNRRSVAFRFGTHMASAHVNPEGLWSGAWPPTCKFACY